ncbi:MAG TPA: hypothetical protein VK856_14415 [Anaerolineaceae bacterium]|nr:hypothetical protein [Anaerolineaceae bacterium]
MTIVGKETIKKFFGNIPYSAELYWLFRQQGKPINRFSLQNLDKNLPEIVKHASQLRESSEPGKKIFVFATLHYWIEHASLLSLALAAQGHNVTFGYLPFYEWRLPINRFDLRRQNIYAKKVLSKAEKLINPVSFLSKRAPYVPLPQDLEEAVKEVSIFDSQYTDQIEDIDPASEIYKLRHRRNRDTAQSLLAWLRSDKPDIVIVPNGTIMELGICYRVSKYLKIPTITYEFGDQRNRFWIGQNSEIMRQNTDDLWKAKQDEELTQEKLEKVRELMISRQKASLYENFSRLWQGIPTQGSEKTRKNLGLDDRPIVLLATNVLGDSLTLGRQVFTKSMAEWIERTVQYFVARKDAQLVIRVHPGEIKSRGISIVETIHKLLPELPEHIKLIRPEEKINTYDLVEIADIGLVYTTTVGMEMAMSGIPTIVVGDTHYRNRGFTIDPDSYVNYYKLLGSMLGDPSSFRLSQEKIDLAWKYAYHFFFDFPKPFPWHLVRMWEDYKQHKLPDSFNPEGLEAYGDSFRYLVGEPIDWSKKPENEGVLT